MKLLDGAKQGLLTRVNDLSEIETLSTRDWVDAARALLLRDGIDAVKVGRIAKECGVTRGGFYWRFRDRDELLDELLKEWRETNTAPLVATLRGPGTPGERFTAAAMLWINEEGFDPRFDTAVRAWAASSPDVAEVVRTVDAERIDAFTDLFKDAGYEADEAMVRGRIVYFHQIGYYALHIEESLEQRKALMPLYFRILTGFL